MINLKTDEEVEVMRESCQMAAEVLIMIEPYVKPGVTTDELNTICHDYIVSNGAIPSPLNYRGFPKSICSSVNDEICHGIPSDRKLRNGDIVNLDITTYFKEYHGDTSRTFIVGSPRAKTGKLVETCREALQRGIDAISLGGKTGDIGHAIQKFVEPRGYSVVREFCGHGIGKNFHEEPQILHFGNPGDGVEIKKGMVFTIEPMINLGGPDLRILPDKWTAVTQDGSYSAQFEHTIHITDNGPDILTRLDGQTVF
jgi:methionyl aminopeptidase